jgi:hypothetical protein
VTALPDLPVLVSGSTIHGYRHLSWPHLVLSLRDPTGSRLQERGNVGRPGTVATPREKLMRQVVEAVRDATAPLPDSALPAQSGLSIDVCWPLADEAEAVGYVSWCTAPPGWILQPSGEDYLAHWPPAA